MPPVSKSTASKKETTESDIVARLFKMYQELTN